MGLGGHGVDPRTLLMRERDRFASPPLSAWRAVGSTPRRLCRLGVGQAERSAGKTPFDVGVRLAPDDKDSARRAGGAGRGASAPGPVFSASLCGSLNGLSGPPEEWDRAFFAGGLFSHSVERFIDGNGDRPSRLVDVEVARFCLPAAISDHIDRGLNRVADAKLELSKWWKLHVSVQTQSLIVLLRVTHCDLAHALKDPSWEMPGILAGAARAIAASGI